MTVKVPVQDRGPLDMKRVLRVIVKISNGSHKIRTQFGLLCTQYRADELEKCSLKVVEVEGWDKDDKEITLREAARKFNKRSEEFQYASVSQDVRARSVLASNMECTALPVVTMD